MLRRVLYSQRKRLSHNLTKQEPTVLPSHFLPFSNLKVACLGNKAPNPLWEWAISYIVEWRMLTRWCCWQPINLIIFRSFSLVKSKFASARDQYLYIMYGTMALHWRECSVEKMISISLILEFHQPFVVKISNIKTFLKKILKIFKKLKNHLDVFIR